MRSAAIFTLLATLGAAMTGAARPCDAGPIRRAYFRAETPEARERVAPFVRRSLPGGIVCAEVPPAMLGTYAAAPGLTFLGYEQLYHPAPIGAGDPGAETLRAQTAADVRRPCWPPATSPVGWGIKAMYGDPNLVQPSGGAGIKIGIVDSGVFPHLDIARRLVKCVNVAPPDTLSPCTDIWTTSHGTMVASVIAADAGADGLGMWGMAPEASLYSYRVCEPNRECWGAYVADGIYAAIADGVNIINMSLEGPGNDEAVRAAIDAAVAHNILVVVSAGNSPPFSYVGYPASYPEVVSVGAIQQNLQPWPFTASGVNDGDYVREDNEIEVAAPGAAVLVAAKSGCWAIVPGTSLAAPMITGLAAKLWTGDAAATRARIQRSARFGDLYVAGDDTLTGLGMPTMRDVSGLVVINPAAGPGGTISPGSALTLDPGATQTFTITPASGCNRIQDVKVDGVSQGAISSYTFTDVRQDHSILATFSTGPLTITASAGPGGAISPVGGTIVTCGGSLTYTITPASDCTQIVDVKVDGLSQGPISSYRFDHVTDNHTIQAIFTAPPLFTITTSAGPGGRIDPAGAMTAACGGAMTFRILPSTCRSIADVKVDGVSIGPTATYTFYDVRADHTIEAIFSVSTRSYTISASSDPGVTISPDGVTTVECAGSMTYEIAPRDDCHAIERLIVDGVLRAPSSHYTFTNVTTNHTILATSSFAGNYAISASAGPGGTISPIGSTLVNCGASRTFTITSQGNCLAIDDVKVDGISHGRPASYTFTNVTANHTIRATFAQAGPFTLTASAGPGGTITPAGASSVACAGGRSYSIAPADDCHRIEDVKVDGVSQGPVASYVFITVTADHTIEASFSPSIYTITARAGEGGTIGPAGDSGVACGESRTYTIAAADCHSIQDVKVDGVSKGPVSTYTFTHVKAGHVIEAVFSVLGPFAIEAIAGTGTVITPEGVASVACGEDRAYTIAPADACRGILDVRVDGTSIGAVTAYTFAGVRANHSIAAISSPSSLALSETHTGASWSGLTDGAIDLTVAGGIPPYAFAWSNGATREDIAGLAAGTYEVRVTDAQGCSNTLSATIANVGPAEPSLSRPAPNPTSGPLRLRYGIPSASAVRVSVLDLQGRELAVLAQGTQPAGWSWATWNGETAGGRAPGGMYFIRLQAGGRQVVQRFALVR